MTFPTKRLQVRKLKNSDIDLFHTMMSNPNVMDPIPQSVFSRPESEEKLQVLID